MSPSPSGLQQGGGTQPVQGQAGSDEFKVISDEMSSAATRAAGKTKQLPILGTSEKQQLQGLSKPITHGLPMDQILTTFFKITDEGRATDCIHSLKETKGKVTLMRIKDDSSN